MKLVFVRDSNPGLVFSENAFSYAVEVRDIVGALDRGDVCPSGCTLTCFFFFRLSS